MLRLFLEGMVYIVNEGADADALMFRNTEQFVALPNDASSDEIYRSGVEHPEEMAAAMMRYASEVAVAEAIGFPVAPAADGWIYSRIGDKTIGVMPIPTFDDRSASPASIALLRASS